MLPSSITPGQGAVGAPPVAPVAPPAAPGRTPMPQVNTYPNMPFALPRFPFGSPGSPSPGGIPGVGINAVVPPATTAPPGGPHALPGLPVPQAPIPSGFPNPFATQSVPTAFPPQAGFGAPGFAPPGFAPAGHVPPGFAPPGFAAVGHAPPGFAPPGFAPAGPAAPGFGPPGYAPPGYAPPGMPALPTNLPVPPQHGAVAQAVPPHLLSIPLAAQLAGQLLTSSAVQNALADLKPVLERPELRAHCMNLSVAILMAPDLQGALRDVAGGALEQNQFATLFAARLRAALAATGARSSA